MEGDDARALREQIAALTAAVAALTAARVPAATPTITIATLFGEFEKVKRFTKSWKDHRNRLRPLIRRLGELPCAALTPLAWAEHKAARAGELDRTGKLPAPHTLNIEFMRAKEMLKFGVAMGLLDVNPLAAIMPEKSVSQRETWLDEAGVQQLLGGISAIQGERQQLMMRAFILLCLDGMMRANEARTLRRDQIRDGVVVLSAKSTKSKRSRHVGLTPRVLEAIRDVPPVLGDPRIFVNPTTRRLYSHSTFSDWFSQIRFASGVNALAVDGERVVIHTLRHSGASAADARGASAMAIKDALGHSTLAITEKYLHRHREAGARDLAKLMHDGAARERRGPQRSEPEGPGAVRRSPSDASR